MCWFLWLRQDDGELLLAEQAKEAELRQELLGTSRGRKRPQPLAGEDDSASSASEEEDGPEAKKKRVQDSPKPKVYRGMPSFLYACVSTDSFVAVCYGFLAVLLPASGNVPHVVVFLVFPWG